MYLLVLLCLPIALADAQSVPERLFVENGSNVMLNCPMDLQADTCKWMHHGESAEFHPYQSSRKTFLPWTNARVAAKWDCDLEITDLISWRDSGLWSCHQRSTAVPLISTKELEIHVLTAPILNFTLGNNPKKEFFIGAVANVTCFQTTQFSSETVTQFEVYVSNEDNSQRKLDHLDEKTFQYLAEKGDFLLECSIRLGRPKHIGSPNWDLSYYEEKSSLAVDVNFGPTLLNKALIGDHFELTFCAKPRPSQIIIEDGQRQRVLHVLNAFNSSCFVVHVAEELGRYVDWGAFVIEEDQEGLLVLFQRVSDQDLILKILLPIFFGSIFVMVCGLSIVAFRKKWWCFGAAKLQDRIFRATRKQKCSDRPIRMTSIQRAPPELPAVQSSPTSSSSNFSLSPDHIYNSLDDLMNSQPVGSRSSSDVYDKLIFLRPLHQLEGHYQSNRTLKSVSSKEDYLSPISPNLSSVFHFDP